MNPAGTVASAYFGGCGVKISRLLGSGFGFGFGAFLASLRPLSLLPMCDSVPQFAFIGKADERTQLPLASPQLPLGLSPDGLFSSPVWVEDIVRCR